MYKGEYVYVLIYVHYGKGDSARGVKLKLIVYTIFFFTIFPYPFEHVESRNNVEKWAEKLDDDIIYFLIDIFVLSGCGICICEKNFIQSVH